MTRTVVISGATRGIGRAVALCLLESGYAVVLNYHANDVRAQETLDECRAIGDQVLLVKGDISRDGDVRRLTESALERFGSIDVLVNNAALNIDRTLFEMTEEDWDRVIDVSMKSVFLASKHVGRIMVEQETGGHIINIGATTGITGRANGLNYCAAKAGVLVMTKCLAYELAPKVRVNCVIPGIIRTPETEERRNLQEHEQEIATTILAGRIGEPEEIAKAIKFLVSEDNGYINGQKIIVDGGQFLY